MSGTSLDGVDAVISEFSRNGMQLIATHSLPYSSKLKQAILDLQHPKHNELETSAVISNELAHLYAETVNQLLLKADYQKEQISAIGSHGQTIRHRPELGFTLQIGNPSLIAELTGIKVVADFRSRDVAAGGQGAPLVPAFHHSALAHPQLNRVILNIGGIANLSWLPFSDVVTGFDSGPGNMLMDAWISQHQGLAYDAAGKWARSGHVIPELLQALLAHPYFKSAPPKSTGRDLFNLNWLQSYLKPDYLSVDVQRTLLELTVVSIKNAVVEHCPNVDEIYVCGGGAHNDALIQGLRDFLHPVKIGLTDELGIDVNWMEAAAFAWLAKQTLENAPGNIPSVTGANGYRILGAVYAS